MAYAQLLALRAQAHHALPPIFATGNDQQDAFLFHQRHRLRRRRLRDAGQFGR
ncbi:hypothetical protein [Massilia sp. CCM 8734]|uniref:hypothetical protein n=1 Tax=Massilia sp. CCM 8734 TaxID=2609283 RepID=UPI0034D26929